MSLVAHQAGAYPGFSSMKRLGEFLLPPGGMLVDRRVTHSSKFSGTHLYTWVERGTMGVKSLAQEHNVVPRPGLEPRLFDPESSALTMRAPHLPHIGCIFGGKNRILLKRYWVQHVPYLDWITSAKVSV